MWLSFRATGLNDEVMARYLDMSKDYGTPRERARAAGIREDMLKDEVMKLLNLSYDWLHSFLPFVLGKINRVSFGLLTDDEIKYAIASGPKFPKSRLLTAVPFVGKDAPSTRSEFSHPDIVVGLTVLAFRHGMYIALLFSLFVAV
jgi:hypothetical protein